ncbi:MAG: alpha/beta hydrolase [Solirubrobacteraceae bacterium]
MSAGAEAVLLIHGQPGGAADWDGVTARLAQRAPTIAIDRPGWDGRSRPLDIAGNARAALGALDAHGVERAIVAGHSLGGAIAAWTAALYPDRAEGLVLIAPAANLASLYPVDYWLARSVAGELASIATLGAVGVALSAAPARRRIARATGIDPGYLAAARRILLAPSAWRAYATEQRALIRDLPALEAQLGAILAPTTIVSGSDDRIVPARAPRRLAEQIPGARLVVIPGAGHLLPQRHPGPVAEAIASALDAATGSNLGQR